MNIHRFKLSAENDFIFKNRGDMQIIFIHLRYGNNFPQYAIYISKMNLISIENEKAVEGKGRVVEGTTILE